MNSSTLSPPILSLIIPVYFNADSIPHLFEELLDLERQLHDLRMDLELIFVDDGSLDQSLAVLLNLRRKRPRTKVIKLARNFGAAAAVKVALPYVVGDCFMFFAADLQEPTYQILSMVREWKAGHRYVVSTRRAHGDPLITHIFSSSFHFLIRRLVSTTYPLAGVGLVLMDRRILPLMVSSVKHSNPNVYSYWLGFTPRVLTYDRGTRQHGRSRWSFRKRFTYLIDTLTAFSFIPIRTISAFGFLVAVLSFCYGVYMIAAAMASDIPVRGFATLAVLISFFGGSVLLTLGIIGEYLWRVFDHVSGRPEAIVEEAFIEPTDVR
jgi:dolichol-phosphate mannosyltransferase